MCGICGIFYQSGKGEINSERLVAMRDSMTHRGPDESGIFKDHGIALGHRRLKVIDLVSGQQPMCDINQQVWLSYNGEIYNYRELKNDLIQKGYHFRTNSDTEVILNLYLDKGVDFVNSMNGMFAIAMWDKRSGELILVRDRLGVKPLYYAQLKESVLFASEIKAILEYDRSLAEFDPSVLGEYLRFRFLAGDQTFFPRVKQVLPAQMIRFSRDKIKKEFYWDIPWQSQDNAENESGYINLFEEKLMDSISLRLISDVPVGTFCSGGVDSSLITALATKARTTPIDTFSVGFDELDFDERRYARMASRHVNSNHHEIVVTSREYAELWPRMVWHMDEPINHAHSTQLYLISKLAKSLVTVVLTGEGSDELFAGYPRYKIVYFMNILQALPVKLRSSLVSLLRILNNRKMAKITSVFDMDMQNIIIRNAAFVQDEMVQLVLNGKMIASPNDRHVYSDLPTNFLNRLLYLECKTYLASLLVRQDKMSMAASVESRVPFLDYRIVETAFRIPASIRFPIGKNKHIIKKLALRYLPAEIITRKKSGFSVPIGIWLRDKNCLGRYLDLITDESFRSRSFFNTKNITALVNEHMIGNADNGDILWELINFELWYRIFIDRTMRV